MLTGDGRPPHRSRSRTGRPRKGRSGRKTVIAPWYSSEAGGFVPRLSVLDPNGAAIRHVDGPRAFTTYAEAAQASRFLRSDGDRSSARRLVIVGRTSPVVYASLKKMFASNPSVRVILDRRVRPDRRHTRLAPMAVERRRAERRVRPEIDDLLKHPGRAVVVLRETHRA